MLLPAIIQYSATIKQCSFWNVEDCRDFLLLSDSVLPIAEECEINQIVSPNSWLLKCIVNYGVKLYLGTLNIDIVVMTRLWESLGTLIIEELNDVEHDVINNRWDV